MTSFNPHEYLNSFKNFESHLAHMRPEDFNLNRMTQLLNLVDNPQDQLKIIHVAGTKGKGSTCAFLSSILAQAGYRVGLYTSPHLHKVNERIRVLSKDNPGPDKQFPGSISDEELAHVLATLRPHIAKIINEGGFLTYFEVLTAAAFVFFLEQAVDLVVLETGLGGRLDATNTAESLVAVLTPISLDHMNILGHTLEQIARQKAGIIKNSKQSVVVAPQELEAMTVIEERCQEFGIKPAYVNALMIGDLPIALKGAHQKINAGLALQVVNVLIQKGYRISQEAIALGLSQVKWAGRFEVVREDPTVVVDCAHNALSAKALSQTILDVYPYRRVILVLGISDDKEVGKICTHLKNSAELIFLTKANHPRAHQFTSGEVQEFFSGKKTRQVDDLNSAIDQAIDAARAQDVVVIAGSVFIVAQAMEYLLQN